MIWRTLVSRSGLPGLPRKYFWATTLIASWDQERGTSTSFCSKMTWPFSPVIAAVRRLSGAPRFAAYAAAQAAAVAHVAAHELGAAAYAIRAVRAAAIEGEGDASGRLECRWQR